ncbi:MAG: molybdenum cofactor guanylyltransferase [Chloroflexota bacterium]
MTTSGILLAGGASRRFPPNKLATELDGVPLFWHALRALGAASSEVVVAIGRGGDELPLPALGVPVRFCRDRMVGAGPLAGLAAGLDACTGDWAVVVAGDMPWVPTSLLVAMRDRAVATGTATTALLEQGRVRPLPCVLFVASARAVVAGLVARGERRLRTIVETPGTEALPEDWWRPHDGRAGWLRDVDRLEDLAGGPSAAASRQSQIRS